MSDEYHNLERSLDALWHCLSQDKRPIAFPIGAGCPTAPTHELPVPEGLEDGIAAGSLLTIGMS